jgi:hypothetical protein
MVVEWASNDGSTTALVRVVELLGPKQKLALKTARSGDHSDHRMRQVHLENTKEKLQTTTVLTEDRTTRLLAMSWRGEERTSP